MKKFSIILIFIIYVFTLCGCNKENKSDLDLFIEKYQSLYPNGYQLNDGWYELSVSSILYDSKSGKKKLESSFFIGNLEFTSNEEYYGNVKSSLCEISTFVYDDFDATVPLEVEYSQSYTKNTQLYRLRRKTLNSSIIEEYSEGSHALDNISFFFRLGTEIYDPDMLLTYAKMDKIYKSIEISNNVLSVMRYSFDSTNGKVTDEYYFNDSYQLIKCIRIDQAHYYLGGLNSYYTIKVLKRIDEKTIEMPTEYDREVGIDKEEVFYF
ncbi:MAG: hypothetical protein NC310_08155 [Roseburia sp.]|nr:hypothetical protein [Anaeroplasma bactoclasticum]MCM1197021.1 hypothetical protein [Roseburia sp.]MCM1556670.1 hypothetical protein [Anaeroplasma bactoclasticum]